MKPAEFALAHQAPELEESGMVLKQMSDHQASVEPFGQFAQLLGLTNVERERLLHEDVLARPERLPGEAIMERGGSGDGDGVDRGIREGFVERQRSPAELLP